MVSLPPYQRQQANYLPQQTQRLCRRLPLVFGYINQPPR
jgi:hypothetical protein